MPASYNTSNITSFCMEWNDFRLQIYNPIAANSPCIHKEIVVKKYTYKVLTHYVAIFTDAKTIPVALVIL